MKEIILLLFWIVLIFMEAMADASGDKRNKRKQHFYQGLYIGGYFLSMFSVSLWEVNTINFLWFYVVMYATSRLFWFDILYNTIMGNTTLYIGKTAGWDRFLKWLGGSEIMWRWVFLCVWLGASVGIIYNLTL